MKLNQFKLVVNLNVQLNDAFQCSSRKSIGTVNGEESVAIFIPDGDLKSQNAVLKEELKNLSFKFNTVERFDFVDFNCVEYAKKEVQELLNLKNPIKYIHDRRKISIFQTTLVNN